MATIDLSPGAGVANTQPSVHGNRFVTHYTDVDIDLDEAETEKGSALAAADVIQALDIPANSVVLAAGIEVLTVNSGSTVLTFDLGVTGGNVDNFVDGFDAVAAVAGDFSSQPADYAPVVVGNTADTLDVLIATLTTTNTGGVFRVWMIWCDIKDIRRPGVALLKS